MSRHVSKCAHDMCEAGPPVLHLVGRDLALLGADALGARRLLRKCAVGQPRANVNGPLPAAPHFAFRGQEECRRPGQAKSRMKSRVVATEPRVHDTPLDTSFPGDEAG